MMLTVKFLTLALLGTTDAFSTQHKISHRQSSSFRTLQASAVAIENEESVSSSSSPRKTIAVTGATGRTGRLVISQLLESTDHNIVALVRDEEKANDLFSSLNDDDERLTIQKCDLLNKKQVTSIVSSTNTNQVIWCATGFSSNPNASPLERLSLVWNAVVNKGENTIDYIGLLALANAVEDNSIKNGNVGGQEDGTGGVGPKIIMLSSAGVTRPSWSDSKKERFEGCADIPIVRLNPFDILNIKAKSEQKLRESGVSYTVVRPTGLKDGDDWFSGSNARPIVSQGDVAVGRIHRDDVASLLLSCIDSKDVIGKTWEVFSLAGYQPPVTMEKSFQSLRLDSDGEIDENVLEATYMAMQQLLPGETQDASALAMGQTYEQLDEGKDGILGAKGEEQAESVAPRPSPM